MQPHHAARAFTLIEILIVVVILGIMSAMVIPQFSDAAGAARDTSLLSQLQTIRTQIEIHDFQRPFAEYDAGSPLGVAFWDELVNNDYLQQPPRNPFSPVPERTVVGAGPANVGWVWDGFDILATDGAGALFPE